MKLGWKKCMDCATYFDWAFFNSHGCIGYDEYDYWGNKCPILCEDCLNDRIDENGDDDYMEEEE